MPTLLQILQPTSHPYLKKNLCRENFLQAKYLLTVQIKIDLTIKTTAPAAVAAVFTVRVSTSTIIERVAVV